MSDFLYSNTPKKPGILSKHIESIYKDKLPEVKEYHGEWGSLAISKNMHFGFNPIENEKYLIFVLEAPLISFAEKTLNTTDDQYYTKALLNRWKQENLEISWDEDFNGPFVVGLINKESKKVTIVTDIMSFIPVYESKNKNNIVIGTHVDTVAEAQEPNVPDIDLVSVSDFIINGYVTYPYTFYKNIKQLKPASIHEWTCSKSTNYKVDSYWKPIEVSKKKNINQEAKSIRKSLESYIKESTKNMEKIGLFISGGEDSRTILSLLPRELEKEAFIFLDHMNREGEIAGKVSKKFNANFNMVERDKNYYIDVLVDCNRLVGSGAQSTHVHTYGFHEQCALNNYSGVFGGLYSDALLKGSHIKKIRGFGRIPFIPEFKSPIRQNEKTINKSWINSEILKEVNKRHHVHYKWIYSMRPKSANEWFELWPSSMNINVANIYGNRRLFRTYEPFMSNRIVKKSAEIPQDWKLNRRIFHRAVKSKLEPVKKIPHGEGWYPYYSWIPNLFAKTIFVIHKIIKDLFGKNVQNDGPWTSFIKLTKTKKWEKLIKKLNDENKNNELLYTIFPVKIDNLFKSEDLNILQKRNLIQVLDFMKDKNVYFEKKQKTLKE